jgi:hypothetical protein
VDPAHIRANQAWRQEKRAGFMRENIEIKLAAQSRPIRWINAARYGILLLALGCLAFLGLSLVHYYAQIIAMSPASLPSSTWTTFSFRQTLQDAGESVVTYAIIHIILTGLFSLGFIATAVILVVHKPEDRMALVVAVILILFGTGFPPPYRSLESDFPAWKQAIDLWSNLGFTSFFLLFYIFPDGRFVPRWTVILAIAWILFIFVGPNFPGSFLDLNSLALPLNAILTFTFLGSFVASQVYRYRRISTPVQRQQTKWVVAGMVIAILAFLASWVVPLFWPVLNEPGIPGLVFEYVLDFVYFFGFMAIPVSLGFAILRYHLFEVDIFIRRTLVYGTLSVTLGLVYFGSVVILQQVLGGITRESSAAIVISTLLIAALFTPLRGRLQGFIDRRFYRQKYDATLAIDTFNHTARSHVEFEHLTRHLVNVVEDTIQPESISLWLSTQKVSPRRSE